MDEVREEIFKFVSKHESIISNEMDSDTNVRFTTYGNRAACRAISEIINTLDENSKNKVIDLMKNKKVLE